MKRLPATVWVFLAIPFFVVGLLFGCGDDDEGSPGDPDGTCFDCDQVCEGTEGEVRDDCQAKCDTCQKSSDCFAWMDDRYAGMTSPFSEWEMIDCPD